MPYRNYREVKQVKAELRGKGSRAEIEKVTRELFPNKQKNVYNDIVNQVEKDFGNS